MATVDTLRRATVNALFAADLATPADAIHCGAPAAEVAASLRGCGHGHTGGRKAAALAALDALAAEEATLLSRSAIVSGDAPTSATVSGPPSTVRVGRAKPDAHQDTPESLGAIVGPQPPTGRR